jgi:hypothetical protein
MGPTKYNDQGPGNGNGHGRGNGNGPGNGHGNGNEKGHAALDRTDTRGSNLGEQLTTVLAVPSIAAAPAVLLFGGTPAQSHGPNAPDAIAT